MSFKSPDLVGGLRWEFQARWSPQPFSITGVPKPRRGDPGKSEEVGSLPCTWVLFCPCHGTGWMWEVTDWMLAGES